MADKNEEQEETAPTSREMAEHLNDAATIERLWGSQPKRSVFIPLDSYVGKEARVNSGGHVGVTVNGFTCWVPVAQRVDVPEGVAEIIEQSLAAEAYARGREQELAQRGVIGRV